VNLDTTLVVMKRNPDVAGGLEPASPDEVTAGLGVDAVPLRTIREQFGFGGKGLPPKHANGHTGINKYGDPAPAPRGQLGVTVAPGSVESLRVMKAQGSGPLLQAGTGLPMGIEALGPNPGNIPAGYRAPAVYGACRMQGKGIGAVALHRQVAGIGVAPVIQANSPARPVRINRIVYGGINPDNALVGQMNVNQDQLIHGGLVPAQVFSPDAAHPVPFDLGLGTQDVFTASMREAVAAGPATGPMLLSGVNCFDSRFPCGPSTPGDWNTLDYPCPPMGKDSRQIILGLGAAPTALAGAVPATQVTMAQAPATLMRMGALTLTAVRAAAAGTSPVVGRNTGIGANAIEYLEVNQINVNGVEIFTSPSQVAATGGISGKNFHPNSNVVWYPDYIVSPADVFNVVMTSHGPAAPADNILVNGAILGCERIATC